MEVVFAAWLVEEGQWINPGDPLFELDTAKANVTVDAFASGQIRDLRVQPGDDVQHGQVVATLHDGEDLSGAGAQPLDTGLPTPRVDSSLTEPMAPPAPAPSPKRAPSPTPALSPRSKFLRHLSEQSASTDFLRNDTQLPTVPPRSDNIPTHQRAAAASASASWLQTPHTSVVATDARAWTPESLVRRVMEILTVNPQYSVRWDGVRIASRDEDHLGILWSTERGPVMTNVSFADVAEHTERALADASARASARRLRPLDHQSRPVVLRWIRSSRVESTTPVLPAGESLMITALLRPQSTTLTVTADQRALDLAALVTLLDALLDERTR